MTPLAERLARLSPEQRARLAQQLTTGAARPAPARPPEAERRSYRNYGVALAAPGNFAGLRFREMPRTPPGPGQVQVEAKAVSLNFRDLMIAMGRYPASPGVPSLMGSDYAGVVTACGPGVTRFREGDRVVALSAGTVAADGTLQSDAHLVAVPTLVEDQVAPMPDGMSFESAAGIPTVFLTSYYALCTVARLQRGERVLIHSATGGVGLSAIAIARWVGAEIFATAGTPEKRAMLATLGIDGAMDSRSSRFADEILERTGGEGIDVVLNTLSGDGAARSLDLLRFFGRFLQVGKADIAEGTLLNLAPFAKGLTYAAIDLSLFMREPGRLAGLLREVMEHIRQGHFAPVPTTPFPIDRIGDALTLMSRYQHTGKLVLLYD